MGFSQLISWDGQRYMVLYSGTFDDYV
jgi:hypothetical protein